MKDNADLFDLPSEDVIFTELFPKIHPKELWAARRVCKAFQKLCMEYFRYYCTSLDFRESELSLQGLSALMTHCRNVREFMWSSNQTPKISFDLATYRTYFWGGKQLSVLDLRGINFCGIRNSYLDYSCRELHTFKVVECDVSCDVLLHELQFSTRIVELDLSGSVFSSACFTRFIVQNKDIEIVKVAYCSGITPLAIQELVRRNPKLRELDLRHVLVTDTTIRYIMEYCPHMMLVQLRGSHLSNLQLLYQMKKQGIATDLDDMICNIKEPRLRANLIHAQI